MNFIFLNTVITGGGKDVSSAVENATKATNSTGNLGFLQTVPGMIIYIVFFLLIFYFIAVRPQKKREKQMSSLQSEIKVGDWVLLDSGMYGKVTDITDQVFIIEFGTNKCVLIPVIKQKVISKGEPNLTFSSKSE